MDKPLVVVFGGSGIVGFSVAEHLCSTGQYRARIADVREPPSLAPGMEFVRCDVRDQGAVERALSGADVALNMAIIQIPAINERRRLAYEVNVLGTINICEAVAESPTVEGMIQAGSWHVFGDVGLRGTIDEGFGFRPDKVEPRARLYALHKVGQEVLVRIFDEMSDKVFGVIRQGTVLGERMPEKAAASIFIKQALSGGPITPYKHSAYRPMLFTYMGDVCRGYEAFVEKILNGTVRNTGSSLAKVVNICYPEPIIVLELAELIRDLVEELSGGRLRPEVQVVDKGLPTLFSPEDKHMIKVDVSKAKEFLGLTELTSPEQALREVIGARLASLAA